MAIISTPSIGITPTDCNNNIDNSNNCWDNINDIEYEDNVNNNNCKDISNAIDYVRIIIIIIVILVPR